MNQETPSDAQLIQEHLRGSSTAISRLWMRYDSLVYGLAHSMLCRRDVAEDIRQEVFFKVYTRLPQLKDHSKFASWVKSITYNTCKGWLRRQRPTVALDSLEGMEHPGPSVEADAEQRELRTLLRQMIDKLPEEYRTVIELHYFEGQRLVQIAGFLGVSESSVKWRIHKAREALQRAARINGYLE
jgi:RNA polymerase sigma-70 factor (ECF subfamily)